MVQRGEAGLLLYRFLHRIDRLSQFCVVWRVYKLRASVKPFSGRSYRCFLDVRVSTSSVILCPQLRTDGRAAMRKTRIGVWLVLSVLATPSRLPAADRPWIEVKSANFTVVSDAGEKSARTVLWELEQVRSAVKTIWSWAQVDVDRPILVLAPRDETGMRVLAPSIGNKRTRCGRPACS